MDDFGAFYAATKDTGRGPRARPRRRLVALAAAIAVGVLVIGFSVFLTDRPGTGPTPVGRASATTPSSPSAVPASAASTPLAGSGRCAADIQPFIDNSPSLERSGPRPVPPLRFVVPLLPAPLITLELYADEWISAACLVFDDSIDVASKRDPAVTTADRVRGHPVHPAGGLTREATGMRIVGVFAAGWAFGRAPAGTTRVEVFFADGTSADAQQLADGWYLAWGVGEEAAHRFSEVTKVVAHTPGGTIVS